MSTPSLSRALRMEMAQLEKTWHRGQELLEHDREAGSAHQSLLYAGMAILIPHGLERLSKGWSLAEGWAHPAN